MKKLSILFAVGFIMSAFIFTTTSCTPTETPAPVRDTIYIYDTINRTDTICTTNCFNAVACYPFTGNANDASGNNFNGTVSNATLTADRKGMANSAYNFSFANGSYIELPTYQSILGTSDEFSVSMWLKFSGVDNGPTPLQLFPDNSGDRFIIAVPYHPTASPADIYFDYGNISTGRLNIKITTFTNWKHFVFVRSKALSKLEIYIDGVLSGSKTASVDITNKNRKFRIGGGGLSTETFNGDIDDVKIFNTALSSTQVSNIYNTEK